MAPRKSWTRDELIIAMNLYCKLPFGQLDHRTPVIIRIAAKLGRTPSSLAMKLSNLASLDPVHQARGIQGLSGASKADRQIWSDFMEDWEELGTHSEALFQELVGDELFEVNQLFTINKSIKSSKNDSDVLAVKTIKQTESLTTIKSRIGQGFFRQMVLSSYKSRCCITGNPMPDLLIASHIIPWSKQSEHRLNPQNGLCLARTHDAAFDRGLITFDESYNLILSQYIKDFLPEESVERNFVFYEGKQLRLPEKFQPDLKFIRFHREEIFIGN